MTVTFVTSFLNMNESRPSCRNIDTYFSLFQHLVDSRIQIHAYVSPEYYEICKNRFKSDYVFFESIQLEDLRAYKELSTIKVSLPAIRNTDKDTYNFLTIMNSKTEFMQKAIQTDIFSSTHFAWIDFGIFHIIKNIQHIKELLYKISTATLKDSFLAIAGIYPRRPYVDFSNIDWRCCGGFFIGDKNSMLEFDMLYKNNFFRITEQTGILTWETNIWAWFEQFLTWNPIIYLARSHDDTMFENIPFHIITQNGEH